MYYHDFLLFQSLEGSYITSRSDCQFENDEQITFKSFKI